MSLEQEMIDRYIQAEKDVLDGKSISMNGRTMSHEDIAEIRIGRREWEQRLNNRNGQKRHSLGRITW